MKEKEVNSFNKCEELVFIKIQNELKKKIILRNSFSKDSIRLVAGIDLAYWKDRDKEYGTCSIVVIDYNTKEVVEKVNSVGEVKVPYIPGFLAFRELPLVIEASKKISSRT